MPVKLWETYEQNDVLNGLVTRVQEHTRGLVKEEHTRGLVKEEQLNGYKVRLVFVSSLHSSKLLLFCSNYTFEIELEITLLPI